MLNEHEQRTLHELECQFVAEDPQFPRSFASRAQRLDRNRLKMSTIVAITVSVVLCSFMLVAGSPGGALAFAVATWLVWWAWSKSHRRNDGRTGQSR